MIWFWLELKSSDAGSGTKGGDEPALLLQLIGQLQLVLLRVGQHGSDLLEAALVL